MISSQRTKQETRKAVTPERSGAQQSVRAAGVPADDTNRHFVELNVSPGKIAVTLAIVSILLVIVGTCTRIALYRIAPEFGASAFEAPPITKVLVRFDLGHEPSLPQLFSSFLLGTAAMLLAMLAILTRAESPRVMRRSWGILSVIFCLLAIDESIMIHEMANSALSKIVSTEGLLNYPWVIAGGLFTLTVAISMIPFLLKLPARTAKLFVFSGMIFVGGAIGIELVESLINENFGETSVAMSLAIGIEEGCEMLGICLFIYGLLSYLRAEYGEVLLRLYAPQLGRNA